MALLCSKHGRRIALERQRWGIDGIRDLTVVDIAVERGAGSWDPERVLYGLVLGSEAGVLVIITDDMSENTPGSLVRAVGKGRCDSW